MCLHKCMYSFQDLVRCVLKADLSVCEGFLGEGQVGIIVFVPL